MSSWQGGAKEELLNCQTGRLSGWQSGCVCLCVRVRVWVGCDCEEKEAKFTPLAPIPVRLLRATELRRENQNRGNGIQLLAAT